MRKSIGMILLTGGMVMAMFGTGWSRGPDRALMNRYDSAGEQRFQDRAMDWRNGAVVYQILLDRFAPSDRLKAKSRLYRDPRKLMRWNEVPSKGSYVEKAGVWSHELQFWGGDFDSLGNNLEYIEGLGIDVVYLNPIFESLTNHKYDAWDYHKIDPVYGDRKDLKVLSDRLHSKGMKLVLDGVFNHMGRRSPIFLDAQKNPKSRWRGFFKFPKADASDYVGWMDVANLPELNMDNPEVRDYIYAKPDSVVQSYLRNEGIDGWRLDVAFDLGFQVLSDLTSKAHSAKPGSVVIGEIWNYPEEWHPSVDGVMNMHGRSILFRMLQGKVSARTAAEMWDTMIADAGMDHILKTWLVLDNHDTPRLATTFPEQWKQRMLRILQFTLPGSPCLYYGSEVGMEGGEDPEQRAPMRWDLVKESNPMLDLHRRLIGFRKEHPALRYGDFRRLPCDKLFAFLRRTNSARDTVVVLANPTDHEVQDFVQLRDSKLQDVTMLRDSLTEFYPLGKRPAGLKPVFSATVFAGAAEITLPPHEIVVLTPDTRDYPHGYNRYDSIY